MSELKEYLCIEAKTIEYKDSHGYRFTFATKSAPEACMESVYLKSEADKVIEELKADYNEACDRLQTANLIKDEQLAATRHSKYKRCLAMAKWCAAEYDIYNLTPRIEKVELYRKWRKRWLELAEKLKPNN